MRFSKIKIVNEIAKTKNLNEIDLSSRKLGAVIAFVGKNGAGKSRILDFIRSYITRITVEELLEGYIENIPPVITAKYGNSLDNATVIYNKKKINASQDEIILANNNIQRLMQPVLLALRRQGQAYVKYVDNDDLKNIKENIGNNLSFENILSNRHFDNAMASNESSINYLNEFGVLNNNSTLNYLKDLTNDILTSEFNLYIKNREKPQIIKNEIKDNKSYQLFNKFQEYVKQFLGNDFTYQQVTKNNTINSILHYNNRPFDLNLFSPGQKTLFAYAVLFYYLEINTKTNIRDSIIIIDEPEKHLHPEAQIALINALKAIVSKSGQLWIATHSIHILSHLEYDEIVLVKDDAIIPPSRTTPGESFNDLMGVDQNIGELISFINSISDWAYGNFMVQCFKQPEVIFANNLQDPQFKLFKQFLKDRENINLLDYGAGKGRIGYTIREDTEVSEKIEYSAYELDKGNFEHLNNVPNIKNLYSQLEEIPENTFDCVLLCNVLHEINPIDWCENLITMKKALKDDGYLLIIEDRYLPKGENAHQFGYLIFGQDESRMLLNAKDVMELSLKDEKSKDRIIFNAYKKSQINPTKESTISSIELLNKNTYSNIKALRRDESKDVNRGRRYANETQLYINSQLALEYLKNIS